MPPSPVNTAVSLFSFLNLWARAIPSATPSCGPKWEIIPIILYSCVPKWKLRSLPFVKPFIFPCHCENRRCNGIFLVVKTPRLRCMGRIYSSSCKAAVNPTEMASCPIPANHLLIFPCRSRISIFSSTRRGFKSFLYKSIKNS